MIENWVNWEIWARGALLLAWWWACSTLVGASVMHACGTLAHRAIQVARRSWT